MEGLRRRPARLEASQSEGFRRSAKRGRAGRPVVEPDEKSCSDGSFGDGIQWFGGSMRLVADDGVIVILIVK